MTTTGTTSVTDSIERSAKNVSSLLAEVLSPRKKPRLMTTSSYQERLRTYGPSTYFAKPTVLSPIICAARGWSNIGNDLLECSHCHAKLCIAFHPQLTPSQKDTLTLKYQEQLATHSHDSAMCLFWDNNNINNTINENDGDDDSNDFPVPLFLADTLDRDFVELLEHPKPQTLLLDRANALSYRLSSPLQPLDDHDDRKLVDAVKRHVRVGYAVLLLVLMGWTYQSNDEEEDGDTHNTTITTATQSSRFVCKVCDSTLNHHVLKSHKYYCPIRCGFPKPNINILMSGEPCWKVVARKVLRSR